MKEAKEIRDYRIQKKKAKERDDFLEAAKICNCLGELYAEHGDHQNAIIEHKEEIYLSEVSGDAIGVAVGHRKVGEAYCSLEMFEKAFFHQQKYLEIAKSNNSTLEQQRALATLGRTYFIQTDCTSSQEEIDRCLESSLKLFLQSLELCDHLYGSVSEKEMLEMRARLYLNLGNVYDKKENSVDSLKFVNKALIIAREQKLPEDIYRCHFSLAGLYFKNNNMDKALHNVKQALSTAKEIHSKPLESDALLLMAQVFLHVSEFERAIQILRQVHSSSPSNEEVVKVLKLAILGVQLTRKYNEETLERNLLVSICEKLGDFYAKFSPQQALKYYKEQLDLCLDSTNSILAPIYNSLALTYYECKQYKDALLYYQLELKMHSKTEYNEKFDTLCMILKILELTSENFEKLKVYLDLAAECARESEKPNSAMMGVYKQFSDDILCCKTQEDYNFLKVKIEQSIDEIEEESEHSSDSGDGLSLNEEEKLFIEHECGNLEDEEDLTDKHTSRSTKRKSKPKINQANALGETPLHVAAIAGNTERVKILLQQGASIHARDASGWQPIHEACNHGHVDIVELLILNGADVNDPGGKHCGGTTPLHDACQNGHLDVVKLLLTHGASLNNRNNDGNTPLEVVRQLIKEDKEEFRENTDDKELYIMRQNVEQFLSNLYVPHDISIKDRNSIIFNQSANDGAQKYINKTSGNDDAILPYKRRKLKNHAPLELFITDSPDLEQIEEDNIPTTPSTASLDEDNCNLDSLDDLDIGLDSGEDFSEEISKNDSPVMSNLSYKIPNKVPNTQNTRDTIHTKSSKSKISAKTKRYRQSKIKVLPTSKEDFQFSSYNKKRNRCNKSMALRQQHLDSFIASPINDARSENLESETQLPESRNELLNYKQNVFRVKVHVNGTCFLIPCSNNGDANVSWLIEKVQSRYRTACGVFARLVLKTKDGALLNENDVIMNIIVNNEELVGEILELDFPSLKERFQLACQDKKITVNENLLEQLTADLNRLQLCNMFLTNDDIAVLTTCLPCNENINALDISKTLLGDDDFKNFAVVLMTLPNLSFLDISNIGITSAGLCYFSDHLEEKVKKEYRTFIKVKACRFFSFEVTVTIRHCHLLWLGMSDSQLEISQYYPLLTL